MRRHPVATPKQGKQRGMPAVRTGGRRPQKDTRESRGRFAFLRPRWVEDIISELRKVTWPTREDTWNLTLVVIIVSAAVGLFLGGVDMFFNWLIDNTLLR
jgi:preprotein translocase subunit SecE